MSRAEPASRGIIHIMNAPVSSTPVAVYGIPNCDTVKKARTFLAAQQIDTTFHDFKKEGVTPAQCAAWAEQVGWERLLNRKGTTWRKLDAATQNSVTDAASAIALLCAHPSAIKRPVVVWPSGTVTVGFDADSFAQQVQS